MQQTDKHQQNNNRSNYLVVAVAEVWVCGMAVGVKMCDVNSVGGASSNALGCCNVHISLQALIWTYSDILPSPPFPLSFLFFTFLP